ncbi:MAG: ribosome maturation factor RimM [Tissierellia bacterium]|nr:ribosome maturation factor RimM [Tissierellia bacterium]
MILVGKILNTHGIKGQVKVRRISDNEKRFDKGNFVYVESIDDKLEILDSFKHKDAYILKLSGIDSIDAAEKLKSKNVYIDENDLMKLEEGEYFIFDLYGLDVYENDEKIGTIKEVLTDYPNEIYVVETKDRDILVPAVKDYVVDINLDEKKIIVKNTDRL